MIRTVTKSDEEFWEKLEDFAPPRSIFDAHGEEHGDIDLRLVQKIENYLAPKIGQWEQSDRWFHNIDYYGDGIRSLAFAEIYFSPSYLPDFQDMLVSEHSDFTILCKVSTDFSDSGTRIGSVAICKNRLLVSYPLVAHFGGQL
jgi:hypothetical protein